MKDLLMERELRAHQLPAIKECPYIRQAVDVIERGELEDWSPSPPSIQKRLVMEWMDTELWLVRPFGKPFSNPRLPQIVTKSILEALVVFHQMKGVHTGVAKNNPGAQTDETRAPEVWRGLGIWHSSDMWSLGVTITHWLMSGTLFGSRDKSIEGNKAAWCLAKITRLLGPIDIPDNPAYKEDFEMGEALEQTGYTHPETGEDAPFITVGSLLDELQKLPREICSEECIDFIEHILVIDPAARPTAEEALKHPYVNSMSLDQCA
ncbi:CMGC protein kinase [Nannizzia gypsea CBS 118893]|uniref:CMGC protein kinase n=1 Tax=Arthroderma gypseum (strain ATCC MYA-4604 / CBS 118893) TaxID=535722 RepID=E4UU97_ARTGP|nr:CMGC protein kinase [Nannizzia gypsea CBS 118893]EFR00864.1 CMGC protein kinase [Nannizzia gypsea CBS 118893]